MATAYTDKLNIDNALVSFGDISIYADDIEQLCEEYINSLPVPEMVFKSAGFSGMLDYIYKNTLKPVIDGSSANSYNYSVLDNIFYNIYLPLCYRYGLCPTVIQFCTLVNISNTNVTDVKNGVYRSNGAKANITNTQTVKKWYQVCESATVGKALNESSVGAMFIAKAVYNYNDQAPQQIQLTTAATLESPEQIAARHASAQLPEKPMLEE